MFAKIASLALTAAVPAQAYLSVNGTSPHGAGGTSLPTDQDRMHTARGVGQPIAD